MNYSFVKPLGSIYYNFAYSVNFRKPKFLRKLLIRVFESKVCKISRLRYADICVSSKCNLKCEHCFSEDFKNREDLDLSWRKNEMTLMEWHDVVQKCKKAGVLSFGITGGEPLLYDQLNDLIRCLDPSDSYITVNSNGILFTESRAKELYNLGVDAMLFSLDSGDVAFHDKFRNRSNAFNETLRAIKISIRAGLKTCIVCTLSHENIWQKGTLELIELARKMKVLLIISRAAPAGKWRGNLDILLNKKEQDYLYSLVRRFSHVRTDFETNIMKYGCSAGSEKIYITPYGDVLPCPFMHISFGNILKSPIEEIRQKMIHRLGYYAQQCFVSENKDFIKLHLSKTFNKKCVATSESCF